MNELMEFLLKRFEGINVDEKKKARLYFYLVCILILHSLFVLVMTLFMNFDQMEFIYTLLSLLVYGLLGILLYRTRLQSTLLLFSVFAIARGTYLITNGYFLIFVSFLSIVILFFGIYRMSKRQYYLTLMIPFGLVIYSIFYSVYEYRFEGVELFTLIESVLYLFVMISFIYLFNEILEQEFKRSKAAHEKSTLGLLMKAHQRRERDRIKETHIVDNRTSVLIVAIDQYHKINQEKGAEIGEKILKEVIALIRNKIRVDDYIIRWNSEDFLVVLNFTPLSNASIVAEKIRKVVESNSFKTIKKGVTVSIACVTNRKTMHETIEKAEELLQKIRPLKENHIELDFS